MKKTFILNWNMKLADRHMVKAGETGKFSSGFKISSRFLKQLLRRNSLKPIFRGTEMTK